MSVNPIQATLQNNGTTKVKPRPAYEKRFVIQLKAMAGILNEEDFLKGNGLRLDIGFVPTAHEEDDIGNNWGSSHYDKWGTVALGLTGKGRTPIMLVTYRLEESYGKVELSVRQRYGQGSSKRLFDSEQAFKTALEQVAANCRTSQPPVTIPGPLRVELKTSCEDIAKEVRSIDLLDSIAARLEAHYPGQTLAQILKGPLQEYIAQRPLPTAPAPRQRRCG